MKYLVTAFFTTLFTLGPISSWAQDTSTVMWNDFAVRGKISDSWALGASTSLRHNTDPVEPIQYLVPRVILNYWLSENHSVGFGYENFFNPIDGNTDNAVYENRNTFQHTYHQKDSWLDSVRTRLEVRKSDGAPHAWLRTRIFARAILSNWNENDIRYVFENELFFYLNPDQSPGDTIEGHWHTLAADKKFNKNWSARLGYMAQYLYREGDDLLSHTIRTGVTYSF